MLNSADPNMFLKKGHPLPNCFGVSAGLLCKGVLLRKQTGFLCKVPVGGSLVTLQIR